ncbi:MAG TPA: NTF2 fold immunity protein [Elusimicrobiota bacterium]|nr:NTF2 fold immunity protein [Elusimicrobiota bacterium]HMZ27112.1 NTF2 fold immunity protein [Elusimicrobiota bacterium]HNF59223.1 NTF2 fold immunity protein [Elusimicrobiota bacterium]HNG45962.1 NTF2 fold immunity protein [Elusimicrobiota bacterium]HNI56512.1 NTF2 fold immunity protein [Elusimicrobiota bacterium]
MAKDTAGDAKPTAGVVPDEKTAIRIALAVWEPLYGTKDVEGKAPYRARLEGNVWRVEGTLPPGHLGGVPTAEISKVDGRILRVSHGQ